MNYVWVCGECGHSVTVPGSNQGTETRETVRMGRCVHAEHNIGDRPHQWFAVRGGGHKIAPGSFSLVEDEYRFEIEKD